MSDKLTLTSEEARDILYGDNENFEIISDKIVDKRRWSIRHELIIKDRQNNKFYRAYYSIGSTEEQDERPWEYNQPEFIEVFPIERTIIVYEEKI